ncbi:hypothetical protein ACNOYE_14640 [Nannocystaceae bacterium ST9]
MSDERSVLERALLDDPDDREAWAVYADYLQQVGDPWGERLGLGLAREQSTGNRHMQLHDATVEHDRRMAPVLLGARLADLLERPGFAATIVFERRYGLVLGARIGRTWVVQGNHPEHHVDREHAEQVLDALLDGPAARLLRSLHLAHCDRDRALARLLAASTRANLRRLGLGWEVRSNEGRVVELPEFGELDHLLASLPELRELHVGGPAGRLDHDRIERLSLVLHPTSLELFDSLERARLPRLRRLELGVCSRGRNSAAARRLVRLLEDLPRRPSLAGLDALGLEGWGLTDTPGEPLLTSLLRVLPGTSLRRLALTHTELGMAGGQLLLDHAESLGNLERIELSRVGMGGLMVAELRRRLAGIVVFHEDADEAV